MAVKIRLKRMGAPKHPYYRLIAVDDRKKRDGQSLELLGQYDPSKGIEYATLFKDKILHWLDRGAVPTETVKSLLKRNKVL